MVPSALLRIETRDNAPWLTLILAMGVVGAAYLLAFGLPGVDLHGPLHRRGIMDPLCGGTRATYVLVRGDVVGAWSWNPLVPLLALATIVVVARLVVGRVSGRWANLHVARRQWVPVAVVGLIALEINQQLQAERLTTVIPT